MFTANERLSTANITDIMQTAYIDYSMSVIIARALPDARDGLKPVQRRVLYAMLREGLLHRWLGRRSLRVDSAVMEVGNERSTVRDLVPLATPETMDAIVRHLLPEGAWPVAEWKPLHTRAWRRKFMAPAIATLIATAVLMHFRGPWALALLLALPLWLWRARVWARHAGWSVRDGLVAFRSGWLDRRWRFAEIGKLQALEWVCSPFDRRHGMATLRFDTAGASPFEGGLVIPYLPEAEARRLYTELSSRLAEPAAITRSRIAGSAAPAA